MAEELFEYACGIEQMAGDDGVEHTHAAFIEDSHDGFIPAQLIGEPVSDGIELVGNRLGRQGPDMAQIVFASSGIQSLVQLVSEVVITKSFAPQGREWNACFGKRSIEIEHAYQAGPLPRPVGDGQNRAAMSGEPGENMVAVLPHRLGDDERRIWIQVAKNAHAVMLAVDESVTIFVDSVSAFDFEAEFFNRCAEFFLHRLLGWPAKTIGRETGIAAGDEQSFGFAGAHD